MSESEREGMSFVQMRDLLLKAERIQQCFMKTATSVPAVGSTGPVDQISVDQIPVNVVETEGAVLVIAAVPGATLGEITVRLREGELTLGWERTFWQALPKPPECARISRIEIPGGHLVRRLAVPRHTTLQDVQLCDGLLRITLAREEPGAAAKAGKGE